VRNLGLFALAAVLEIAGCFAFWLWLRRGVSPFVAVLGVVSLVAFAVVLTRVDSAFAGRAYAAYGGIYIAASLVWLWLAEDQRPTGTDLLGAGMQSWGHLPSSASRREPGRRSERNVDRSLDEPSAVQRSGAIDSAPEAHSRRNVARV
jgi:small multidrug resistance family-3 protein